MQAQNFLHTPPPTKRSGTAIAFTDPLMYPPLQYPVEAGETWAYAALAEKERNVIADRTRAALAAAKARGARLGNPDPVKLREAGNAARTARADARADLVLPAIESARRAGAKTLREIADALSGRGIPSPRGATWHPASIARVLERVGAD